MRERLGSGPRIVRTLFTAIVVLGLPIAIALPGDLNAKVCASGAVALVAGAAILAAARVQCAGLMRRIRARRCGKPLICRPSGLQAHLQPPYQPTTTGRF